MKQFHYYLLCVTCALWLSFIGCSSSDESAREKVVPPSPPQPSATEVITSEVTTLRTENDSLKQEITKAEQKSLMLTAHATDLETQVADLQAKLAAPPPKMAMKPATGNTHDTYEQALETFRARKYQDAAAMFQGMLDSGAPPDLQDNCHYWLGECSYAMKNFTEAIDHFQQVFTFKISEKKDDAQIMIANSYYALGKKDNARTEYQKFIDKYPASPYVKRAKERLSKL